MAVILYSYPLLKKKYLVKIIMCCLIGISNNLFLEHLKIIEQVGETTHSLNDTAVVSNSCILLNIIPIISLMLHNI